MCDACTKDEACYPCYLDWLNQPDPNGWTEDQLDELADRADRNWLRYLEG